MRLFGTAVLVAALAASQCAAQSAEQALPIRFTRAEPQHQSLRERKLSDKKKKKKKHHHNQEETQTYGTQIPQEDNISPKETRQNQPSCSVCGEGKEVGNPDAGVSFPGQAGQIPCGTLQNMGLVGLIPPPQCKVLPQLISTVCECESIVPTTTVATAPATTTEATKPGSGKASKSAQLSHSMSVPSKAGKSIHGKATSTSPSHKSGKSDKTVISTKGSKPASSSKGSKMMASKASSKGEKSASKSSKTATTVDAKAQKVTSDSSKAAKATGTASTAAASTSTAATAATGTATESAFVVPTGASVKITCPAGSHCCVGGSYTDYNLDGAAEFGGVCGDDPLVTSGVLTSCNSDDNCVVKCTGCDVEIQN